MELMKSISQSKLKELMNNQNIVIIDVRSPEEFNAQHIPNAINLTIEQLGNGELKIDDQITVVTVCGKGGGRSEKAADYLRSFYKSDVYFLEEGTFGWFESILE
jgi:rhodanese-related sulfurtransferase